MSEIPRDPTVEDSADHSSNESTDHPSVPYDIDLSKHGPPEKDPEERIAIHLAHTPGTCLLRRQIEELVAVYEKDLKAPKISPVLRSWYLEDWSHPEEKTPKNIALKVGTSRTRVSTLLQSQRPTGGASIWSRAYREGIIDEKEYFDITGFRPKKREKRERKDNIAKR